MAEPTNDDDDMYALDRWLRKFGLWRESSLRKLSPAERKSALAQKDFSRPFLWQRTAYDPDGHQLITLTSHTTYDPESGIFDDKIIYWRHMPWDNTAKPGQKQDQYVLQIRGIRDPAQAPSEIPRIIPEQIWWNGSQIFDGPVHGGPHNPKRPEYIKLINRMVEFSKRVKERLNDPSSPLQDVGRDFSSAALSLNLAKAATGSAQNFRGLSDKGWDPIESTIHSYFTRASQKAGQKVAFTLPAIRSAEESLTPGGSLDTSRDISPLERLHVVNGFYQNTVEPVRQMMNGRDEATSSLESGISYLASAEYFFDEKSGRHVYSHMIAPEDPMDGSPVPEPFEMVRLEYSQNGDVFTLENSSFMGSPPGALKTIAEQLSLLGFNVACNDDLVARRYPDYKNHAYSHKLQKRIHEMGVPSKLSETGGDFGWIPFNGCGFEKHVDIFGDGIGGGNAFISRGLKDDGTISEVMIMHDVPLAIGGPDSDFDGMNPNFMPYIGALRNGGAIVLSHDHFDHASLEYLAKQVDEKGNGWLKGVRVICREDVSYIVKKRLAKLDIPKTQWPNFVTYERPDGTHHPDLVKMPGERTYAYCARDEEGKARIWVQACANGSLHSAETDMFAFTGCHGDEVYHDTYMTDGDALDIRPHGQAFMERGQLALADLPGVTLKTLTAKIKDPNKLYVGLDEITNVNSDGVAPTIDEFKNTMRKVLKALPENRMVIHHPFSTSHLEIRATREVCNEAETLRNTTSVGANAEMRDACMNLHGVDPLTDLRTLELPPEKLPQIAYDTALKAVETYIDSRHKRKAKVAEAGDDIPARVFQFIYDQAQIEVEDGNSKPRIIFDAFFDGNVHVFDDIASALGIPKAKAPREMPNAVKNALEKAREEYKKKFEADGKDADADTTYFMLRSLANDGKVLFKSKGDWNDSFTAQAILRDQKEAARYAGRTSKRAKNFRANPGKLWVLSTGATGSAAEQFSSLSRYARGDSLFDYDELSRNTGYKIDPEKAVLFITQTPSMGEDAQIGQEAVIRDVVNNRGNTVIQAFRNGFYINNPGADRARYMKAFGDEGWKPEWDAANNRIRIGGQPFHVHGHRFWGDLQKKFTSGYYKAKLIEFIHMPGEGSFMRGRDLAQRSGRRTSITAPEDYVFMQCRDNEKGESVMHKSAFLTPSYWLFQIKRKYGLQYGGIVKMVLATVMRRTGNKVMDALEARSGADGYVAEHSPIKLANDWLKARNGSASARQAVMGPALADVQAAGSKPMGRTASSLVHKSRWWSGKYQAPDKEPG
jgi:hypothetical protein